MLFNQRVYVLPGASPDRDVAFHIIGTVVQQASQGRCVLKVSMVAKRLGCCSQRVGNVHTTPLSYHPSVSASRDCSLGGDTLVHKLPDRPTLWSKPVDVQLLGGGGLLEVFELARRTPEAPFDNRNKRPSPYNRPSGRRPSFSTST